jgi:hypothetical protein
LIARLKIASHGYSQIDFGRGPPWKRIQPAMVPFDCYFAA